jgi:hypothetical protein
MMEILRATWANNNGGAVMVRERVSASSLRYCCPGPLFGCSACICVRPDATHDTLLPPSRPCLQIHPSMSEWPEWPFMIGKHVPFGTTHRGGTLKALGNPGVYADPTQFSLCLAPVSALPCLHAPSHEH